MYPYENLSLTDMDGEVWKPILGYEGLYEVSNIGRVKSLSRINSSNGVFRESFIRIQIVSNKKYLTTALSRLGVVKIYLSHRLVAQAFIPNPENKPQVNHKNKVRADNRVENLEWATRAEDDLHRHSFGDKKDLSGEHSKLSKVFYQYTYDGHFVKEWKGLAYARKFGFHRNGIKDAIKGIRKAYKGFIWSFVKLH